jgi:cytosine/adenosine deaminase-related metal-dependent hydrolase
LAETPAEQELLVLRRGPFVSFLQELGVWDPEGLAEDVGHVLQLLSGVQPTLIVHGNYLPPEAELPANASLVYCPRTHAAFGHRPHPFRAFLDRGICVALGTDSLASNPDLNLLAEARFLHQQCPDVPAEAILRMATLSGAEALGWADETGSLRMNKSADFVVLPLEGSDNGRPYEQLLTSTAPPVAVFFRGRQLVSTPPAA